MFRRQKVSKKLSADELKSKLYAHFDKSGSLNQLRTQIRSQLASELFKMASASTAVSEHNKTVDLSNTLLPLQVCNWLVYDHLIRQGYQYTLSTFVSETNLPYPEKLLAVGDILALIGLDNSSSEYQRISNLYSTDIEKEGLHSLLLAIIKSVIFISDKDNQQIENAMNSSFEVEIKEKLPSGSEKIVLETQPKVLLESLGKNSTRVKKLHEATSLESSYYDQLQSIREERDKEIQNLRHKLVQELERLHLQELSFSQEIGQEKKEIKKERDLLFSEREKLKDSKDLFLKEQENKLEKKIREVEEIHIKKLHSKDNEIAALQHELKEKEKKLGHMEFELSTHREEYNTLKRDRDDTNRMYKSVHDKYNSLLDENTSLVKKFESMADYDILKDELVSKGREISNLQGEIENLHRTAERDKKAYIETVTSLELKLKATEPKLQCLQKELDQAKNLLEVEKAIGGKELKKLEQDLSKFKDTVLQKVEEGKQDIHDLHQTIHMLHYELTTRITSQPTKPEMHDPSRTIPKVAYLPPKNNHILKSNRNNSFIISQQYKENALNFTSDYKSRFNNLQQEMGESFDKYSLISHTAFDIKMPNIKPSLSQNAPTFTHNMKFHQPSFATNVSNTPSSFMLDTSKNFMTFGNLNLRYGGATVPNFMNKSNSSQLSETLTSSQNIYDSSKAVIADSTNVTSIEQKHIYPGSFLLQNKQTSKASEVFKPSSSTNTMYDQYQDLENFQNASFLPSGNDQNKFDANKTTVWSSCEIVQTVPTELTENLLENIPVTKTVSTVLTENTFKDTLSTNTAVMENTENFPNTTSVPQRSFLLPAAREFSFQNTNNGNTEQINIPINRNFKDTALPQTSSNPTASLDSLKQPTASPIIVDLDAAWKRKTSLPSVTPPLLPNSNQLIFAKNIGPDEIIFKGETKQSSSISSNYPDTTATLSTEPNTKTMKITDNISSSVMDDQNIIKNYEQHRDLNKNQAGFSQAKTVEEFELEKEAESQNNSQSVALGDVSNTNEEIKEKSKSNDDGQIQSAIKPTPEDSLSELSEVHVSCGSEQEEQKEESDNW